MTFDEVLKIVGAILASLGGASVIIFALSNWLGKIWANRIMESDRAVHSRKLEEMRADLAKKNQTLLDADRHRYSEKLELLKGELAKNNQSLLEAERSKYSGDIEKLKATLAIANAELSAENKARRDYEYDARKRLYKECEPLLFRLSEASENALHRIFSLARTARNGDLGPKEINWLQPRGYYMVSTIYNLLIPLVVFRLLQNKITLVDLTMDSRISNQYRIAKLLYISFTEDFVLAQTTYKLEYQPSISDWKGNRNSAPEKWWRQGIYLGDLDVATQNMIKQMPDGVECCKSFGEFLKDYYNDIVGESLIFGPLCDIFHNFHPNQRPILWRILVVQAHLNAKLMEIFVQHGATNLITEVPTDFCATDMAKLDWRDSKDGQNEDIILNSVRVAKDYLNTRLPDIFQRAEQ